jgi:hypothetical protein
MMEVDITEFRVYLPGSLRLPTLGTFLGPKKFLSIVSQDPSDSKSNRLHVDIFWFCLIHVRYILL